MFCPGPVGAASAAPAAKKSRALPDWLWCCLLPRLRRLALWPRPVPFTSVSLSQITNTGTLERRRLIRRWQVPGRGQERRRPANALGPQHRDQYGHADSDCVSQRVRRLEFLPGCELSLLHPGNAGQRSCALGIYDAGVWRHTTAARPRCGQRAKPLAGWQSLCLPAMDARTQGPIFRDSHRRQGWRQRPVALHLPQRRRRLRSGRRRATRLRGSK